MKTDLTVKIENELVKKYYFDKDGCGLGRRFAFECEVVSPKPFMTKKHGKQIGFKHGRVDFITLHTKQNEDIISCFEIKISKSDFKSKSGHNLIGDYNYYVVPAELVEYVKERRPTGVGIISYDEKSTPKLKTEVNPTRGKSRFMKSSNSVDTIKKSMLTACNSTIRRLLSYD